MSRRAYAPALANAPKSSSLVKHKLESVDESNEEYSASKFGGFTDYNRRKKVKLQNQDALIRARAPDNLPAVFAGMVIHINGYTKPGRVELWNSIVTYGGVYKQYLEGKTDVTHIVASNLTKKKQEEFAKYRVVRPEWIVDSIAAGKALSWQDDKYRVIDAGANQKVLGVSDQGGFALNSSNLSRSYKRVTSTSEAVNPIASDTIQAVASDQKNAIHKVESDEAEPAPIPVKETSAESDTKHLDHATRASTKPESAAGQQCPEVEQHAPPAQKAVVESRNPQARPHTKTAKDADFIQDYFRNSRLHHLSTWKANLRLKIDNLAKARSIPVVPNAQKLIMHIDFDCFFAAVSAMKRPDVVDKPCAVTHGGSNSGEIASCNYKAREYGIKNGMWMKEAVKLCRDIISLPYEFEAYELASDTFYRILLELKSQAIEAVSIDEALLDISNLFSISSEADLSERVETFAMELRNLIRNETGVEVSLGIGANVLQAKLATKKAKPAGHFFLQQEQVIEFLNEFEVASIPGVGYSTAKKLEEQFNVSRIEELRQIAQGRLQDIFGPKTGVTLADASIGKDDTVVGDIAQRKLVSIEINWGIRLDTPDEVSDYMRRVSEELCRKLREVGFVSAQHLLVKVMRRSKTAPVDPPKFLGHGVCDKFNTGREIPTTGEPTLVWKHSLALLESLNIPPNELRGIGVALTKLQSTTAVGNQAQRSMSAFFGLQTSTRPETKPADVVDTQHADRPDNLKIETPSMIGTQFVIPSQIDNSVLDQLPESIRSKIAAHRASKVDCNEEAPTSILDIPNLSDIDPADLAALPPSVRHEIMLHSRGHLPQTPTKGRNKTLNNYVIKTPSPKKHKRQGKVQTLTQVNFVERPVARKLTSALVDSIPQLHVTSSPSAELDRDVLANLPADIRQEIVLEDRRKRMAIRLKEDRLRGAQELESESSKSSTEKTKRTLALPERTSRYMLGDLGNESLQSLRQYLSTWYAEGQQQGPDQEDLLDFEGYLRLLITEEKNLERVEALLKWLTLIVTKDCENLAWIAVTHDLLGKMNNLLTENGFGALNIL